MTILGLIFWGKNVNLVDCETGEIMAQGSVETRKYLKAHDGEYVLTVI